MVVDLAHLVVQLIHAVEQSHSKGVCHGEKVFSKLCPTVVLSLSLIFKLLFLLGDIKCENVLVTSWNWLYLTDFASFKPTYIPDDDPSDFSFFFDTGGRRRCYLAPEVSPFYKIIFMFFYPLNFSLLALIGVTVACLLNFFYNIY